MPLIVPLCLLLFELDMHLVVNLIRVFRYANSMDE